MLLREEGVSRVCEKLREKAQRTVVRVRKRVLVDPTQRIKRIALVLYLSSTRKPSEREIVVGVVERRVRSRLRE